MNVIYNLNEIKQPLNNPVLTIGNFDGVHRGHLVLFDKVKDIAKSINGQSVVMTFEPHPIKVMKPGNGPPLITPTKQKLKLISESGIGLILCISFTKEFASLSAQEFVKDILINTIGVKEVVVGYDYTFGSGRQGDTQFLKNMGEELGFKVHVVEPIHLNNTLVSSTSIRQIVQEGNLEEAKRLLGREYQISGTVTRGAGRGGKLLGIPTANLIPVDELIPKKGVYAVITELNGQKHFGVCNIGHNPTFGENAMSIETHILDFSEDILGKEFTIRFIRHLRSERPFKNAQDLSEQIGRDIKEARELFNLHE
jgi:riboflavin kinase/FMN adenylyltransferase